MKSLRSAYARVLETLENRAFPLVVWYATHPLVIFATILLLLPLLLDSSNTSLALALGNYTNVCSAAVSSIVLLQSIKHEKQASQHHNEAKKMHAESMVMHQEARRLHRMTHRRLEEIASDSPPQKES